MGHAVLHRIQDIYIVKIYVANQFTKCTQCYDQTPKCSQQSQEYQSPSYIVNRFARESIHYITGTLIFLGLLGTFWGLVITLGAFGELIGNINFDDVNILNSMQDGMSQPLAGMATAFTSSLLGLGASLIMGFLEHMVGRAHNTIFTELGDYMSAHTHTIDPNTDMIKRIDETIQRTNTAIENIEFNTSQKNV